MKMILYHQVGKSNNALSKITQCSETLGLSMELNDDILVQTTSLQTIARVKRVKCFMLHKVA